MNMQIKNINDKKLWEELISRYSPQSFFQSWTWGESVRLTGPNTQVWRIALVTGDGEIAGLSQIVKVVARRGIHLHLRHGPVLKNWKRKSFHFLLEYIKRLALREKAAFIRFGPLIENTPDHLALFKKAGFVDAPIHRMNGEFCWVLDLDKNADELLKNMRKTTRYLIKKATNMGVIIRRSESPGDMAIFNKLYEITAKRHGFVRHREVKWEFEKFVKEKKALLFLGEFEGEIKSAAVIIFYNHQAIYHHSASIEQKIPVNYLLQWHVILEAKKRNMKIYNFWGIAPDENPRHPWTNLTIFKKGFGGRTVEYLHAQDLPVNILGYTKSYLLDYGRKLLKGY